jgi:hypothetical protein
MLQIHLSMLDFSLPMSLSKDLSNITDLEMEAPIWDPGQSR